MPWIKVEGLENPVHVRLCRQRRKSCKTCKTFSAELECDGCDKALCRNCAVAPKAGVDFCPACFRPAFEHWKALVAFPTDRAVRRVAFRVWARANAETFLRLAKPLSTEAVQSLARGSS